MIRTLQNAGPTLKIILGALLVIICASMAITLIPGFGSNLGLSGAVPGVLATVGDERVTVAEVQRDARQMLQRENPRGGPQSAMLLGYFSRQAAERLIN